MDADVQSGRRWGARMAANVDPRLVQEGRLQFEGDRRRHALRAAARLGGGGVHRGQQHQLGAAHGRVEVLLFERWVAHHDTCRVDRLRCPARVHRLATEVLYIRREIKSFKFAADPGASHNFVCAKLYSQQWKFLRSCRHLVCTLGLRKNLHTTCSNWYFKMQDENVYDDQYGKSHLVKKLKCCWLI